MEVSSPSTTLRNVTHCDSPPDDSRLTYVWMTWVLAGSLLVLVAVTVCLLVRYHCGRLRHLCGSMNRSKRVNTYEDVRSVYSVEACGARLRDTNAKVLVTVTDKKGAASGHYYYNLEDFQRGRCPNDDHQQLTPSSVDRTDHNAVSPSHFSSAVMEKDSHRRKRNRPTRRQRKRNPSSKKSHSRKPSSDSHVYSNLSDITLTSNNFDTSVTVRPGSTASSLQEHETECRSTESQIDLTAPQVGQIVFQDNDRYKGSEVKTETNITEDHLHPTFNTDSLLDTMNVESETAFSYIASQERDAIEFRHKEFIRSAPLSLLHVNHSDTETCIENIPFMDELTV